MILIEFLGPRLIPYRVNCVRFFEIFLATEGVLFRMGFCLAHHGGTWLIMGYKSLLKVVYIGWSDLWDQERVAVYKHICVEADFSSAVT